MMSEYIVTTLNTTPNEMIEVAKTQSQQNLINLARANSACEWLQCYL